MHIFIGYSKKALHASVQSFFEQLFKIKYLSVYDSIVEAFRITVGRVIRSAAMFGL